MLKEGYRWQDSSKTILSELDEEGKIILESSQRNNNSTAMKSINFRVSHQVEELTHLRFHMGGWEFYTEASRTTQALMTTLFRLISKVLVIVLTQVSQRYTIFHLITIRLIILHIITLSLVLTIELIVSEQLKNNVQSTLLKLPGDCKITSTVAETTKMTCKSCGWTVVICSLDLIAAKEDHWRSCYTGSNDHDLKTIFLQQHFVKGKTNFPIFV